MPDTFICALSGLEATDEERPLDLAEDELDDLPVGWTRVTFERRVPNPKWVFFQQVKEGAKAQLLAQVPKELQDNPEVLAAVEVQVDAQYYAFETSLPPYLVETEEVFLAPIARDTQLRDAVNGLREQLGLGKIVEEPEDVEPPAAAERPKRKRAAKA